MSTHGALRRNVRLRKRKRATMTAQPSPAMRRLQRASERVRDTESRLARDRAELRAAVLAARAEGASISAIGRVLGISRQRAQRVIADLEKA